MRRLTALIATASLLTLGTAAAAPKDEKSVAKAWEKQCLIDVAEEGVSKARAKPFCKCAKSEVYDWIDKAEGDEHTLRLWSAYYQGDPDITEGEFYDGAAAAGMNPDELKALLVSLFFEPGKFYAPCVDIIE
ncbi:MAG: hypothetical protein KJ871_04570 [Alphaproteobacteria bacterium]|nr:hypothetical protein [Alphaproteobacteria bacterium]MBU2085757.1 hypothetical protein [Alphaproteobacteria bacterium]MBU2141558.1 hypothetical protein [Alphaproteobacteria bacterium]MBU2197522.1 hypothetical protein [Alphaproteobacteria bacterium]